MKHSVEQRHTFKIMDGDAIIGNCIVHDNGDGVYFLGCLCVVPTYEHQGVGQSAMEYLFAHFPQAKRWALETPLTKPRNHRFYQQQGFSIKEQYQDGSVAVCLFEKRCKPRPTT